MNFVEYSSLFLRTQKAGIPIDVQWNDLDYMTKQNDFTVDDVRFKGLKEFVNGLHKVSVVFFRVPVLFLKM